jgi:hypothetical protein
MSKTPETNTDRAQVAALGAHFERIRKGEIPAKPAVLPQPTFTWGFTAEERARLEEARIRQKDGPAPK